MIDVIFDWVGLAVSSSRWACPVCEHYHFETTINEQEIHGMRVSEIRLQEYHEWDYVFGERVPRTKHNFYSHEEIAVKCEKCGSMYRADPIPF